MRNLPPLVIAVLLAAGCQQRQPTTDNAQAVAEAGFPTKGVDRSRRGQTAADTLFRDPYGQEITLAEFRGGPVLVNLWATWCAPCVKELPTLDAVAQRQGGEGALRVIAISQDTGPQGSVEAFLVKLKVEGLDAYHDEKMALAAAFNVQVLPTTILFDAQGREVWRYVGDLDWTGEEAVKLLAETSAKPTP